MSNAAKNILIRAICKRLAKGELFDSIIRSYPRLTPKEIDEIKKEIITE